VTVIRSTRFSISSASLFSSPTGLRPQKSFSTMESCWQRRRREFGIGFTNKGVVLKPAIREVVFLDTVDFRLYNHAFILRQRVAYESGFPAGELEIVFKFRHEDMQKAAELDVRPKFAGNYRIKFKAEALPLRDQVGGYRLLFSHNAPFPLEPSAGRRSQRPTALTSRARARDYARGSCP
jgi:hypothetical protein